MTIKISPEVGIHHNIPDTVYHEQWDAVNVSAIKAAIKSERHYYEFIHALPKQEKPSPALLLGQAVHCAVLEPDRFNEQYVREPAQPEDDTAKNWRATKAYKEWVSQAKAEGFKVVTADVMDMCNEIHESLYCGDGEASELVRSTTATEVSYVCTEEQTGLRCKVRADGIAPGIVWDLKTIDDMANFQRHYFNYGYYLAAMFYPWVIREAEEGTPPLREYRFVVVEKKPPYEHKIFKPATAALDYASIIKIRPALDRIAAALETGEYPGYDKSLQTVDLPAWAYNQN